MLEMRINERGYLEGVPNVQLENKTKAKKYAPAEPIMKLNNKDFLIGK